MLSTNYVLSKALEVTDWLVSVGLSEKLAEDLMTDLCDVYGIRYEDLVSD